MSYEEASCIRRYHLYQSILTAVVGESLVCEREPSNSSDRYAMAVLKNDVAIKEYQNVLPLVRT